MIEFFDYQCVYCSRLAPVMEQVIKAHPQPRKEWPIFGGRWKARWRRQKPTCDLSAEGADAYLAYHNGIYATGHNEGKLTGGYPAAGEESGRCEAADVEPVLQSINDLAQEMV